MTYVDLLTYLTDVQKIEKEELAELLAIPKKHIDGVLCGQVPLKKKWLKNLSLYTGIPEDAIQTGNFSLETPAQTEEEQGEGEEAPVVEATPEMKKYNTERHNAFCKKRYKDIYFDFVPLYGIGMFFAVLGLVATIASFVRHIAMNPAADVAMFMLVCAVPNLMVVFSVGGIYKIALKGNLNEEKNFKFYSVFVICAMVIFVVAGVYFKVLAFAATGFGVASILYPVYLVFVAGTKKEINPKLIFSGLSFSFLMFISVAVAMLVGDVFEQLAEKPELKAFFFAALFTWCGLFATGIALVRGYEYFGRANSISKHFGQLENKPLFKKQHKRNRIIAFLLAVAIFAGGLIGCQQIMIRQQLKVLVDEEAISGFKVEDYTNQDVKFTDEDDIITIEVDGCFVTIPSELSVSKDTETLDMYKNEKQSAYFMIQKGTKDVLYETDKELVEENAGKNESFDKIRETITQLYGFYPRSTFDYCKFSRIIKETGIDYSDSKTVAAHVLVAGMFELITITDVEGIVRYIYEDNERQVYIEYCTADFDLQTYTYDVIVNKTGDYETCAAFRIKFNSEYEGDTAETAYKIINSVEFK